MITVVLVGAVTEQMAASTCTPTAGTHTTAAEAATGRLQRQRRLQRQQQAVTEYSPVWSLGPFFYEHQVMRAGKVPPAVQHSE